MLIRHEPLWEFDNVEAVTDPTTGKRFYITPHGNLPSMTTVLGANKDKQKILEAWKNRVGHKVADGITQRAGRRGTFIHRRLEHYLLTGSKARPVEENENKRIGEFEKQMHDEIFSRFINEMERHMDRYHASEVQLYSKLLGVAGSTDLIAPWDGKLSIIDFKTSLRIKKKEWITSYFLQTTGYAMMLEEMKGAKVEQIVVLIAPNDQDICQVFVENPANYKRLLAKEILAYRMEQKNERTATNYNLQ